MVTTPFGVYFHVLATDEFRRFQNIAMDIVRKPDEPDSAGPGRLVSPDKWLHDNSIELGDTSGKHWNVLLRQMRLLEAWGDFNQVKPATVEEAPDDKLPLMGGWVRPVLVNGFLKSYTEDSPANMSSGRWYVTPATILEGRAVLASLLWGTRQLRGHPSAGSVLSRWFRETYPATGNQDYRFIADLVASFNKHPDIESYLGAKAGAENFETRLRIFGLATWVAFGREDFLSVTQRRVQSNRWIAVRRVFSGTRGRRVEYRSSPRRTLPSVSTAQTGPGTIRHIASRRAWSKVSLLPRRR